MKLHDFTILKLLDFKGVVNRKDYVLYKFYRYNKNFNQLPGPYLKFPLCIEFVYYFIIYYKEFFQNKYIPDIIGKKLIIQLVYEDLSLYMDEFTPSRKKYHHGKQSFYVSNRKIKNKENFIAKHTNVLLKKKSLSWIFDKIERPYFREDFPIYSLNIYIIKHNFQQNK